MAYSNEQIENGIIHYGRREKHYLKKGRSRKLRRILKNTYNPIHYNRYNGFVA